MSNFRKNIAKTNSIREYSFLRQNSSKYPTPNAAPFSQNKSFLATSTPAPAPASIGGNTYYSANVSSLPIPSLVDQRRFSNKENGQPSLQSQLDEANTKIRTLERELRLSMAKNDVEFLLTCDSGIGISQPVVEDMATLNELKEEKRKNTDLRRENEKLLRLLSDSPNSTNNNNNNINNNVNNNVN